MVQLLLSEYTIKWWFNFPPHMFSIPALLWVSLRL